MKQFKAAVAVLVAASLLTACGGGSSNSIPTTKPSSTSPSPARTLSARRIFISSAMRARFHATNNNKIEYFYSRYSKEQSARRTMAGGNLNYYGGPVQTSPKIDIVYWGWQNIPDSNADPSDIYDYMNGFFNAIGGGGWINTDTQYYGSNGYVANTNPQLGSVVYDTSTPPNPYSDSDVQNEAQAAANYLGDANTSVNYIVVTPSGYTTSGFGSQWCAYHSYTGSVSYTDMPYIPDAGSGCGQGSVNYPGTNDGVSIVGGHEEAETQTDPQPSSGWVDSSGAEIGDKCAWVNLMNNSAAGNYPTQPLWDNAISGCAQSGP